MKEQLTTEGTFSEKECLVFNKNHEQEFIEIMHEAGNSPIMNEMESIIEEAYAWLNDNKNSNVFKWFKGDEFAMEAHVEYMLNRIIFIKLFEVFDNIALTSGCKKLIGIKKGGCQSILIEFDDQSKIHIAFPFDWHR